LHSFLILAHHLSDSLDDLLIGTLLLGVLVESHLIDGIEQLLEIFLNGLGFRSLRQNLQEGGIGDEIETGNFFLFFSRYCSKDF
jgi:hypothetical protein